jgi:hypothetical protein
MKTRTAFTPEQEASISRIQEESGTTRKNAIRKMRAQERAAGYHNPERKAAKPKRAAKTPVKKLTKKEVSANRSEGLRLFKLAGRPSKADFVAVYGPNGPKWTWEQRAAAGVDAEHFQAALKAKQSHKAQGATAGA